MSLHSCPPWVSVPSATKLPAETLPTVFMTLSNVVCPPSRMFTRENVEWLRSRPLHSTRPDIPSKVVRAEIVNHPQEDPAGSSPPAERKPARKKGGGGCVLQ